MSETTSPQPADVPDSGSPDCYDGQVFRFDAESWCMVYCLPNSDIVQMCSNIADQRNAIAMSAALKEKGGHVFSVLPAGVLVAALVLAGKA